jgi:hypothetical protein
LNIVSKIHICFFVVYCILWNYNTAAQYTRPSNIRVSLLTVDPGNKFYSIFGHSAIRVKIDISNHPIFGRNFTRIDSSNHDMVYNYGTGIVPFLVFLAFVVCVLAVGIRNKNYLPAGSLVALLIFASMSYPFNVLPFVIAFVFLSALCLADESAKGRRREGAKVSEDCGMGFSRYRACGNCFEYVQDISFI